MILVAVIVLSNIAWCYRVSKEKFYIDRATRITFFVDELTTTPERQQRAFDEIAKDEDGAFIYLIKYLGDDRLLAHGEALFLNTHPNTFEKYFQAGGRRVGETILRYLCWKTESCDVNFNPDDAESVKIQRQKIESYCRKNFLDPSKY